MHNIYSFHVSYLHNQDTSMRLVYYDSLKKLPKLKRMYVYCILYPFKSIIVHVLD